tara:strand:- start:2187 stop:3449 length:1263 start_codon:yes stop_codon:yes gene_type:complete
LIFLKINTRVKNKVYSVSHISTSSIEGGSAISARRIHEQLRADGIKSQLFVSDKDEIENCIYYLTKYPKIRIVDNLFNLFFNKLGLQYFFIPSSLFFNKKIIKSSIIQLYNIHGGYFQLSNLRRLKKIPMIWRLSDYWSMTGHCAYPGNCEKWMSQCQQCPSLDSYPSIGLDNTNNIWKEKKEIINNLNIKIVVPSTRLYNDVKKSPILKNKETYIIPNGIDTDKFKPLNKSKAREKLKISNKFSISFIAQVAFNNFRKGTHILKEVIESFKDNKNIQFLVAGIDSNKWENYSFNNLIHFNYNKDTEWKRLFYNASDLVIVPSIHENFPNVILESMSCGTPVISFNTGGISNIINSKNGVLIENLNTKELIKSISLLSKKNNLVSKLEKCSRETILRNFSVEREVNSYIEIYRNIINEKN